MQGPAPVPVEVRRCTPSEVDGISRDVEDELRSFGVVLLQRASILLRLPQHTCVTASAVLQRFFFRRSLADFDVRITAAASLLLACKLQGNERRLKQIIPVFYRLYLRSDDGETQVYRKRPVPNLDPRGRDALEMKQAIISVEQQILSELGFGASLLRETPHRHMLQFLRGALKISRVDLAQSAWNFLNDSQYSTLCCEYQPHEIATASIFLAADKLGIQLPSHPPWWNTCYTRYEDMMQIAKTMNALYRRPFPPRWHAVHRKEAEVPGCLRSPETSPTASPREASRSRSRSPKAAPKKVVRLTVGRANRR